MNEAYQDLENKPKKFWDTERGQIVSSLVHEINGVSAVIGYWAKKIKNDAEQGRVTSNKELIEAMTSIIDSRKRMNDSVDYTYEKIKKLEGY